MISLEVNEDDGACTQHKASHPSVTLLLVACSQQQEPPTWLQTLLGTQTVNTNFFDVSFLPFVRQLRERATRPPSPPIGSDQPFAAD